MCRRRRQFLEASTFAIFIALSVLIAASFWDPDDPRPESAMLLILSYCLVMMAIFAVFAFVLDRLGRPPISGGSSEPPEGSPAGVPVGPRRPRPLVAHAIPPVEGNGDAAGIG